jgi:hypothetical protein
VPKLRVTLEGSDGQAFWCGAWDGLLRLDVSAARLAAAVQPEGSERVEQRDFANTASGHRQLIAWLLKQAARVRVTLEATGVYSLACPELAEGWGWRWMRPPGLSLRC